MSIVKRIEALQKRMREHSISAYIIYNSDDHQSEYIADAWKYVEWYSGFAGSAATLVVWTDGAGLWTDGRYFTEAQAVLQDTPITLYRMGEPNVPTYIEHLITCVKSHEIISCDAHSLSYSTYDKIAHACKNNNIIFQPGINLCADLWIEQPVMPKSELYSISEDITGQSRAQRLELVKKNLMYQEVESLLVSSLDEIAWVLNVRGNDVVYNPVFYAYLLITQTEHVLFTNAIISDELQEQLQKDSISILPYEACMIMDSSYFSEKLSYKKFISLIQSKILIPKMCTSFAVYHLFKKHGGVHCSLHLKISPIARMKAIKTKVEIANMYETMKYDGVAMVKFLCFIESEKAYGMTEYDLSECLLALRAENEQFIEPSFESIIGFRANGAIIHYRPLPVVSSRIEQNGMLLIDSGGQYKNGTTDITRTIYIGTPSLEHKHAYTNVLKGMIALSCVQFPAHISGSALDALARQYVWQQGYNYKHGTGHGIGFALNVHEGPNGINPINMFGVSAYPIHKQMLYSNEPGFYKEGEYGIRIENIMEVVETTYEGFYTFRTLTLCPIDTNLIDRSMLTDNERVWLNTYHQLVYDELSPYVFDEELVWLQSRCQHL